MGAHNIAFELGGELPTLPLKALFVTGTTAARTGFMLVIAATDPGATDKVYAKGCLLIKVGTKELKVNDGAGYGSAPSWKAVTIE